MIIVDVEKFMSILSPYVSLDFFSGMTNRSITIIAASVLMLIFLVKNTYLFLIIYFQGKIFKDLRFLTSVRLFKYYINMPYVEHLSINPAILIRTIQSDIGLAFIYITSNITLIRESVILLSIFILLLVVDPLISSFALLFLGIPVFTFYFFYRKKLKAKGTSLQELNGKKIKTINQSLGLIKETKLLNREKFFFSSFFDTSDKSEKINFFSYLMTSTPRLALEVITISAVVIVCALLVFIGRSPDSILPIVSLFAVSAIRLIPGLNTITASLTTIRFITPSFDLIVNEMGKLNSSTKIENIKNIENQNKIKFNNNILLKDLSFNYKAESKIAINNISMNIKKGSRVGIIGRSGSGKSTLVDIISCLRLVNKGKILIDNNEMNSPEVIRKWQNEISYVSQNTVLFKDTLRNNIIFSSNKDVIDHELLSEVINKAQLDKFINSLPNKLDTDVGELGTKVSGGQKQRIGIARAMYKQPKFLIFDEATNALDHESENLIMETILSLKSDTTILMISHKKSLIEKCDKVYQIVNSKISEVKK